MAEYLDSNGKAVDYNGFVKTGNMYSGRIWHVDLWNPVTKETMSVKCVDTDYDNPSMGIVNHDIPCDVRLWMLDKMPLFGGSKDIKEEYDAWRYDECVKANQILIGMTVEVIKGRKYPIGTIGKVVGFYEYRDMYGRLQTKYVVLEDGKRVPYGNCKAIA